MLKGVVMETRNLQVAAPFGRASPFKVKGYSIRKVREVAGKNMVVALWTLLVRLTRWLWLLLTSLHQRVLGGCL